MNLSDNRFAQPRGNEGGDCGCDKARGNEIEQFRWSGNYLGLQIPKDPYDKNCGSER